MDRNSTTDEINDRVEKVLNEVKLLFNSFFIFYFI